MRVETTRENVDKAFEHQLAAGRSETAAKGHATVAKQANVAAKGHAEAAETAALAAAAAVKDAAAHADRAKGV